MLSLVTAAAFVTPAAAAPPIGPVPATTNGVTLTTSAVTGLSDGSTVNFTVNTTGATKLVGSLNAHLCIGGFTSYGTGSFGYSGSSATRCVYSPGIVSGGLTGSDYEKSFGPFAGTESTSGSLSFNVGTGSLVWGNVTGQGPLNLTADSTHTVDLVIEVGLAGDSVPTTYFIQPLAFAGPLSQPDPPTAVAATAGDATAHVTWTAPANTGNGTIDHYVITATPTSGPDVTTHTLDVGTALVGNIPLQNFSTYNITVHSHISAGPSPTSVESSPAVSVSPLPPAPTGVAGSGASGQVNLSWSAPVSSQAGLTEYEVTATGGPSPIVHLTGSTATSYAFTGLTDGTPYTFSVRASYGGSFGRASNASAAVVPSSIEIDQLIQVTRPQGALVLTQSCDPSFPNPVYPTDPVVAGTPGAPGACSVDLGTATLVTTAGVPGPGYPSIDQGQFYKADGELHQVTVSDTRDGDAGWNVNGKLVADFVSGSQHFGADQLGWVPTVTDKSGAIATPGGTYTNTATAGAAVLPAVQATDHGLGSSQTFASATAGGGLGVAHLDADLHILIPIFAQHGQYTALLQITAI